MSDGARRRIGQECPLSVNPHPIVLTTASERHRAELLALARPAQRGELALFRVNRHGGWQPGASVRAVRRLLALLFARDGAALVKPLAQQAGY